MNGKCPICGAPMNSSTCDYCGFQGAQAQAHTVNMNVYSNAPQAQTTVQIPYKSRVTATLLCFFFGIFGAHRFYVGKTGTGILWLCTLGLFGFGTIVDFIMLICGNFTDCFGRKLI